MGKQKIFTQAIVVVMVLMLVVGTAAEAFAFGISTIRQGVRGVNVQQLGDFLTRHGYNAGPTGVSFGSIAGGTLFSFQRSGNLLADDIVGKQTFGAVKVVENDEEQVVEEQTEVMTAEVKQEEEPEKETKSSEFNFTPQEIDLFARLVHSEAVGESYEGQVAVAASVLNRLRSSRYPNTISAVIYQISGGKYQYSPVLDGRINRPAGSSARKAVEDAINGWDPSYGASGFYNPRKTSNQWVRSQPVTRSIGQHVFFR
jgi:N-acetylmuramoyl-L-alanine amidase